MRQAAGLAVVIVPSASPLRTALKATESHAIRAQRRDRLPCAGEVKTSHDSSRKIGPHPRKPREDDTWEEGTSP